MTDQALEQGTSHDLADVGEPAEHPRAGLRHLRMFHHE